MNRLYLQLNHGVVRGILILWLWCMGLNAPFASNAEPIIIDGNLRLFRIGTGGAHCLS